MVLFATNRSDLDQVLSLALLWGLIVGVEADLHKPTTVKKHRRKAISFVRLGLDHLLEATTNIEYQWKEFRHCCRLLRSCVYVAREYKVTAATLSQWREAFLVAGESGLRHQEADIRGRPRERVRRLMRAHGLQAPQRTGHPHGPQAHDRTIITEQLDVM